MIRNTDRVIAELQHLKVSDEIAMPGYATRVERLDPGQAMVVRPSNHARVWSFELRPAGAHTRLISPLTLPGTAPGSTMVTFAPGPDPQTRNPDGGDLSPEVDMTTLKPRSHAETLAAWAWAAVALTPVGWFYGALAVAYSHLGDVVDVSQEITGFLLFVAAPMSAFVLAVYAARAGHRSGKIALTVSGLLLLATIVLTLLYGGWIGLAVAAVVAVLVLVWVRSRRIAVVVSGLLLLAILTLSAWQKGGWINAAVIVVIAVVAVLVFAWVRSRRKPPPGPDGARREGGSPVATAPPGASGRTS